MNQSKKEMCHYIKGLKDSLSGQMDTLNEIKLMGDSIKEIAVYFEADAPYINSVNNYMKAVNLLNNSMKRQITGLNDGLAKQCKGIVFNKLTDLT